MKKFILLFLLVYFVCFAAQARYVRKVREPDFFIPEQFKMHQQERLPAVDKKFSQKQKIKQEVFSQIPDYKRKYGEYLADITAFSKDGIMPENKELDADLSAMESGDVFEVTESAPDKIVTLEHKQFDEELKRILKN